MENIKLYETCIKLNKVNNMISGLKEVTDENIPLIEKIYEKSMNIQKSFNEDYAVKTIIKDLQANKLKFDTMVKDYNNKKLKAIDFKKQIDDYMKEKNMMMPPKKSQEELRPFQEESSQIDFSKSFQEVSSQTDSIRSFQEESSQTDFSKSLQEESSQTDFSKSLQDSLINDSNPSNNNSEYHFPIFKVKGLKDMDTKNANEIDDMELMNNYLERHNIYLNGLVIDRILLLKEDYKDYQKVFDEGFTHKLMGKSVPSIFDIGEWIFGDHDAPLKPFHYGPPKVDYYSVHTIKTETNSLCYGVCNSKDMPCYLYSKNYNWTMYFKSMGEMTGYIGYELADVIRPYDVETPEKIIESYTVVSFPSNETANETAKEATEVYSLWCDIMDENDSIQTAVVDSINSISSKPSTDDVEKNDENNYNQTTTEEVKKVNTKKVKKPVIQQSNAEKDNIVSKKTNEMIKESIKNAKAEYLEAKKEADIEEKILNAKERQYTVCSNDYNIAKQNLEDMNAICQKKNNALSKALTIDSGLKKEFEFVDTLIAIRDKAYEDANKAKDEYNEALINSNSIVLLTDAVEKQKLSEELNKKADDLNSKFEEIKNTFSNDSTEFNIAEDIKNKAIEEAKKARKEAIIAEKKSDENLPDNIRALMVNATKLYEEAINSDLDVEKYATPEYEKKRKEYGLVQLNSNKALHEAKLAKGNVELAKQHLDAVSDICKKAEHSKNEAIQKFNDKKNAAKLAEQLLKEEEDKLVVNKTCLSKNIKEDEPRERSSTPNENPKTEELNKKPKRHNRKKNVKKPTTPSNTPSSEDIASEQSKSTIIDNSNNLSEKSTPTLDQDEELDDLIPDDIQTFESKLEENLKTLVQEYVDVSNSSKPDDEDDDLIPDDDVNMFSMVVDNFNQYDQAIISKDEDDSNHSTVANESSEENVNVEDDDLIPDDDFISVDTSIHTTVTDRSSEDDDDLIPIDIPTPVINEKSAEELSIPKIIVTPESSQIDKVIKPPNNVLKTKSKKDKVKKSSTH